MKFALIGCAGYIAPKHLQAIKEVGGELIAALDPHDSVGILDSYFPNCRFFTEFERFDRHLDKLRRVGEGVDFVSICSPNYLHDAHCRFALRLGADAICEKPLVVNTRNLDGLIELEQETNRVIYPISQLRLNDDILTLKNEIKSISSPKGYLYNVKIEYSTYRGYWYDYSWKANEEKSGGLIFNIGVHLIDLLIYLFGENVQVDKVFGDNKTHLSGNLSFPDAKARFYLSIKTHETSRKLIIDGREIDLSNKFRDLHVQSYENICHGTGLRIKDVRRSIELCNEIRNKLKGK